MSANLCEIFSSVQGEGLYLGERQVFIRFAGCNLSCQYCDTPQALELTKEFKVEVTPGKKDFQSFYNPAEASQIIELVKAYEKPKGVNHSVSLTGGEPLLQVAFLKEFIPLLKQETGLPVYLDTNGTLPDHLGEVIEQVDIVAMDIKLPSATGLSPYWKEHKKTLEVAYLKELFIKVVVTKETKIKEIDEAVTLIAEVDDKIPLVIQPVTPFGPIKHRPAPEQLFSFQNAAKRKLKTVRIIPQVHKLIGLL